jgi:hypothetical protein
MEGAREDDGHQGVVQQTEFQGTGQYWGWFDFPGTLHIDNIARYDASLK